MKTLSHTSRRLRKAITPLALAAACVTAPVWSATDSMDAMWNYTRPAMGGPSGSIGGYLGGLQVRVPVRNFNLLSVDAPRFHQQWLPEATNVELFALSPDTQKLLEGMGHKFGAPQPANHVAAILIGAPAIGAKPVGDKRFYGANDPRRNSGLALGY